MLLDPLEEQFDLPARLVQRADGCGRQREVVGEVHQCLAGLGILEADAAQMVRIVPAAVIAVERDGLPSMSTLSFSSSRMVRGLYLMRAESSSVVR